MEMIVYFLCVEPDGVNDYLVQNCIEKIDYTVNVLKHQEPSKFSHGKGHAYFNLIKLCFASE